MRAISPRRCRFKALLVGMLVVIGLSGCYKVQGEIAIHPDDTFSGEITVTVDKKLAEEMGFTQADISARMKEISGEFPLGAKGEAYAEGDQIGAKITIPKEPIANAKKLSDEESLNITRENDTYKVTGIFEMSPVPPGQGGKGAETTVRFTFPGKVISSNGKISGNTVVWTSQDGEAVKIEAVGSAKADASSNSNSLLLWVLIGVAVVVVASGATFFLLHKNKAAQPVACDDRAPLAASEPLAEIAPAAGQPGASVPTDSSGSGQ